MAEPRPGPSAHPCELAQPDRDLLLDPPTQSAHPDDFSTFGAAAQRILGFQKHYQEIAQPFEWRFTRRDLARLLIRSDQHERLPQAA
jgi:hypothetical protein